MNIDAALLSAFLVGLLGSTHCLGMCGGIVSALTLGLRADIRRSPWTLAPYLLAYNTGRIASYAIAGGLAGTLSAQLFGLASPTQAGWIARLVSAGFMIALGLYLAGWWPGLQQLEKCGGVLWRHIEPLGRRFLPVDRPFKACCSVWSGVGCRAGWCTRRSPGRRPPARPARAAC